MNLTSVLLSSGLVLILALSIAHSIGTGFLIEKRVNVKNDYIKSHNTFYKSVILDPTTCDNFFSTHSADLSKLLVENKFPSTNINTGIKKLDDVILKSTQDFIIKPFLENNDYVFVKVYLTPRPFQNTTPLNHKRLFHTVKLQTQGPPLFTFEECSVITGTATTNINYLGEMGTLKDEYDF